MKIKFFKSGTVVFIITLFLTGITYSCKSSGNKNNSHEETEHNEMMENDALHTEGNNEEHHHDGESDEHHEEMTENISGKVTWSPSETPFSGQLSLAKDDAGKINARIVTDDGNNVLSIEPSGDEVIMLLNGTFGNLGAELQYSATGFTGKIAVIFHYKDENNYDAMVLNNHDMELQRIENGNIKVLDSNEATIPSGWAKIKLSAAGEHLKCYMNGKQYNHGHAEIRPAGRIGILLKGKGKVELKSMTVIPLEE